MGLFSNTVFNTIFRRNQVFLGVVFLSAFGLEMGFDTGSQKLWDYINKGRQWKDIKYQYLEKDEEE